MAEDLGGPNRRAINEDAKDKRTWEFRRVWESMDAKDKAIIRILVFGSKIMERVRAEAQGSCERKFDSVQIENRKDGESKFRAFELAMEDLLQVANEKVCFLGLISSVDDGQC